MATDEHSMPTTLALQNSSFVGTETVDLLLDELPDALRNSGLDVFVRSLQEPLVSHPHDNLLGEQVP